MAPIENYRELLEQEPRSARNLLRDIALTTLAAFDRVRGREAWLARPRVQVLCLHHIFRDEEQAFRRLLCALSRNHTFIGYSEGVKRIRTDRIDRPYVCFTADDGFRNNLAAAHILEEFETKLCLFVCTDIVDTRDQAALARFCSQRLHFPPMEFLDWDDLENLRARGHEVGSHSRSHLELSAASLAELEDEISGSREALIRHLGDAPHFAFPYGGFRHFSSRAREIVFRAGFESCASGVRGCHVPFGRTLRPEEICVRRDHVIAAWNPEHVLHFLVNNARRACPRDTHFQI